AERSQSNGCVFPGTAGGEALEVRPELVDEPEAAVGPARFVDQRVRGPPGALRRSAARGPAGSPAVTPCRRPSHRRYLRAAKRFARAWTLLLDRMLQYATGIAFRSGRSFPASGHASSPRVFPPCPVLAHPAAERSHRSLFPVPCSRSLLRFASSGQSGPAPDRP